MAVSNAFYLVYEFTYAGAEYADTAIAGTGAATNKLTATAHGMANGTIGVLSSIVTLTNVSVNTIYYVVGQTTNDFQLALTPGGSAIAIGNSGSATFTPLTEIELPYANKITPSAERNTYEWKGSNKQKKIESLSAINLTLDSACVPQYVHKTLFSKSEMTGLSRMTNAIGYGGGNDRAGVTLGLRLKAYARKFVANVETGLVTVEYYYPAGTLTQVAPPGVESGAAGSLPQYSFSASAGQANIIGGTLTGMATDDFYVFGEV